MAANRAARIYADAHRHPAYRYAHACACRYIHSRANPHRYACACRCARAIAYRYTHAYTCAYCRINPSTHTRCAHDNTANANYCARCPHTRAYRRRYVRVRATRYIHAPA